MRAGAHARAATLTEMQEGLFGNGARRPDQSRKMIFKTAGGFLELLAEKFVNESADVS